MRIAVSAVLAILAVGAPGRAHAALSPVSDFGTNPGALDMFEYVPAGLPANRPLVVVMHGCTQTAAAMEAAGWNALADANQFAVLYPQQRSANQQLSCFTWYGAGDISRDMGEASSILEMVDKEIAMHGIDGRGLRHGPVRGRRDDGGDARRLPGSLSRWQHHVGHPLQVRERRLEWLDLRIQRRDEDPRAMGRPGACCEPWFLRHAPTRPDLAGHEGLHRCTAQRDRACEAVDERGAIDQAADATDTISTATRTQYTAGTTVAVELYLVDGMGHAIATGSDPAGPCPSTSGTYFADEKICSTLRAAQFFGLAPGGGGSGSDGDGGSGSDGSGDSSGDPGASGCAVAQPGGCAMLLVVGVLASRRRRRR